MLKHLISLCETALGFEPRLAPRAQASILSTLYILFFPKAPLTPQKPCLLSLKKLYFNFIKIDQNSHQNRSHKTLASNLIWVAIKSLKIIKLQLFLNDYQVLTKLDSNLFPPIYLKEWSFIVFTVQDQEQSKQNKVISNPNFGEP